MSICVLFLKDIGQKMKDQFKSMPDEFMSSPLASKAKVDFMKMELLALKCLDPNHKGNKTQLKTSTINSY